MLSVDAGSDGLPVIIAKLEGVAVYLDNWAIIELANGDAKRRERFVAALKACGSLLFSFTNSIELGEAEGEPANRVRTFLDEIGARWIPIELNPWTVMDREMAGQTEPTSCISMRFIETFVKDRMYEQSPEGSKVVDLSPDNFFKLTSVMKWANEKKDETRKGTNEIDDALIKHVAEDHAKYEKARWYLDNAIPNEGYSKQAPTRFALLQLLRLLVTESKKFTLKKGDGRDLCHAALGAAYGSLAALDKHWKRRVEALPTPNGLARIYSRNELDQLVDDLERAAKETEARRVRRLI
jgi:hypothetical protein